MTTFAEVRAGVRQTVAAVAQAQDDGRSDDMSAWCTPDTVMEIPGVATLKGVDAVREAFAQPGWRPDPDRPQRHVIGGTVVTQWNDREAKAITDVTMLKSDGTAWSVAIVARYHDEFEESQGRWLLRRRLDDYVGFTP